MSLTTTEFAGRLAESSDVMLARLVYQTYRRLGAKSRAHRARTAACLQKAFEECQHRNSLDIYRRAGDRWQAERRAKVPT